MKKTILTVALALAGFTVANAQKGFYVSLAGGSTYKAGTKVLSKTSGFKGSYGEGIQAQLRGGYFFNDKVGIDLGVGYLHGDKQPIASSPEITGAARAFGLSLTGVYNISKNVYVRGGLLTKLGGKTKLEGKINSAVPTAQGVIPLSIDFTRNNTGKFPLGFTGAFGVKFDLGHNFGIFAEMDYQGINVPADKSKLGDFTAKLGSKTVSKEVLLQNIGSLPASVQARYAGLLPLLADEISFVDNPTVGKSEAKAIEAPYSSFGFSLGVTYFFNFSKQK